MKFHRIDIRNINSLYGDHPLTLDETFGDASLFLIMGPTGSGKTTILDAVCLALFGATARQPEGSAKSIGAQVNSEGTGKSRASVVFSVLDGDQRTRTYYKAVWEFWRAHDKPHGTPQMPRRELFERNGAHDDWGDPIVSSIKQGDCDNAFDAVLDEMSLDDFLRSVMLAQGEFAALLNADESAKAAILERLTDTADYRELGRLTHQRWSDEAHKLQHIQDRLANVDGATPDELDAAQAKLSRKHRRYDRLARCSEAADTRYRWLQDQTRLTTEREKARKARKQARDRREKYADDFARRAAHRQAAPAQQPLAETRRIQRKLDSVDKQIPELTETHKTNQNLHEDAQTAEKKARQTLADTEEELEDLEPAIKAAKSIKSDLGHAQKQLENLEQKADKQADALADEQREVQQAKKRLDTAVDAKKKANTALEAVADDASLAELLPALRTELVGLTKADDRTDRAANRAKDLADAIAKMSDEKDALDQEIDDQKQAVAPLEAALNQARQTLQHILGDAETPRDRLDELREALERAKRRLEAIDDLAAQLDKRRAVRQTKAELVETYQTKQDELGKLDTTIEQLGDDKAQRSAELEQAQSEIKQLKQRLLAADLRRDLRDGQPCPVCGGQDHPKIDVYGDDALDDHEQADQNERAQLVEEAADLAEKVDQIDTKLDSLKQTRTQYDTALARLDAKIESADQTLDGLDADIEDTAQTHVDAADDIDWQNSQAADQALARQSETAEVDDKKLTDQKQRLRSAEDDVKAAQNTLDGQKEDLDALTGSRKDLQRDLDHKQDAKDQADKDLARHQNEAAQTRQDLRQRFADNDLDVDLDADDAPDFDAALQAADARLTAYRQADKAVEAARQTTDDARQAHDAAKVRRDNARQLHNTTTQEVEDARSEVDDLGQALADHLDDKLDGRDPEAVEDECQAAVKEARNAVEARSKARQTADKARQSAADELARATDQRAQLGDDLADAKQALDDAIALIDFNQLDFNQLDFNQLDFNQLDFNQLDFNQLDFSQLDIDAPDDISPIDAIDAALLDDDDLEKVEKRCDTIETDLRDAGRDIERLDDQLDAHQLDKPDDFSAADYTLDSLQAARDQLDAALADYNQQIGALEQEIDHKQQQLDAVRELQAERDAQKKVHDGWKELHDLIGVSEGQKFKQFAQALNLDRIVNRANQHLAELYGRYRLKTKRDDATNLPTLNFEIVDCYRAGTTRAVSTLSGGETFLVSLALALALADQQQIEMPIETLFLDEGFGTLDRAALRDAIDLLNELHTRGGRTVGVISHVEALQDRITSQVVVERQDKVHSSVRLRQI